MSKKNSAARCIEPGGLNGERGVGPEAKTHIFLCFESEWGMLENRGIARNMCVPKDCTSPRKPSQEGKRDSKGTLTITIVFHNHLLFPSHKLPCQCQTLSHRRWPSEPNHTTITTKLNL